MALLPKVKLKAVVSFPAAVLDGVGIDVTKTNGSYQFDLAYDDFAPPVGGLSDPTHQNALLWNNLTGQYSLAPITLIGSGGAVPEAPVDGTLYGRKDATWAPVPAGGGTPSSSNPLMDGTAAPGVLTTYSRGDHVHPSDTSRATVTYVDAQDALKAPIASPTFTGNPQAPTPSPGDNDTSIATTAFVTSAVAAGGGGIPEAPNDGTQYGRQSLGWTPIVGGGGGSGSGDVTGPASAVADSIAVFNATTGKVIKDGGKKISDLVLKSGDTMTGDLIAPRFEAGKYTGTLVPGNGYWFGGAPFATSLDGGAGYSGNIIYDGAANERIYIGHPAPPGGTPDNGLYQISQVHEWWSENWGTVIGRLNINGFELLEGSLIAPKELYSGATVIPYDLYNESGVDDADTLKNIYGAGQNPHTTRSLSVQSIESRPEGSGQNGPAAADFALSISHIKQNWTAPSGNNFGELDGINVIVRNGGPAPSGGNKSDSSGIHINVANMVGTGYVVATEGNTSTINPGTYTVAKQVGYQLCNIDESGVAYGAVLTANTGVINAGLLIQGSGGGSFTDFIKLTDGTTELFKINGSGALTVAGGVGISGAVNVGGDLTINKVTPTLTLDKTAATQDAVIYGKKGGLNRWGLDIGNGAPESGSDVGSDFDLLYFNDAGGGLSSALHGLRTTGLLTVKADPTAPLGIATKQYVDNSSGGTKIGIVKIQKFTSSSNYTPSANLICALFETVGGGGGGGGVAGATGGMTGAGGGGAGGYSRALKTLAQIMADSTWTAGHVSVVVGASGAKGAAGANPGTAGGSTYVGNPAGPLCKSFGGAGGFGSSIAGGVGIGGDGGAVGIGDVTATGATGQTGPYTTTTTIYNPSGFGGSSIFGGGGKGVHSVSAANAGNNGTGNGAGGGGASQHNIAANAAGGDGSSGIVVVTEFCTS